MGSRNPRSVGVNALTNIFSCPTPGPTGRNDFADPTFWMRHGICRLLGASPGPLGRNDHAEPLPANQAGGAATNPDLLTGLFLAPTLLWRFFLLNSVGRNAQNDFEDVCLIQLLLNKHRLPPRKLLTITGVADEELYTAIEEFQQNLVRRKKLKKVDGKVDPGGKTFQALAKDPPGPKTKSGSYWVTWANTNAQNSDSVEDLAEPFKTNAKNFIAALEAAGATVAVTATKRHANRAYLFHWSWKIALGKSKPSEAGEREGVDIEWDHGDLVKSKAGAQEMVTGFGLAVPPKSTKAPSLTSNHIEGNAIDMTITWTGNLKVKNKDGTEASVPYMSNANNNTKLHAVGATYSVFKLKDDEPHWSHNGG